MKISTLLAALLLVTASASPAGQDPVVYIRTELGVIVVMLDQDKAPVTSANFLRYVEAKRYDGEVFHRTVTMANQPADEVKIEVIQGGLLPPEKCFPPVPLERTSVTGLKHLDGTLSMARSTPDSATSSFFICLGDQPELDFGGRRNKDGQGFAAFGRVVQGMDTVKKIQRSPCQGQVLSPPIKIFSAGRPTGPDHVAVQHILIAFQGSIPEEKITRSREAAQALALDIFGRAKKGEDFDRLVKSFTDDEYPGIYRMANFGLELLKEKKEYPRAGMVWSFGEVGFGLPVGGVGLAAYDPISSKYGWHIIKRLE
jgi:peptidyl-prolyl cis-trans isomerase A (cyclophilin A)